MAKDRGLRVCRRRSGSRLFKGKTTAAAPQGGTRHALQRPSSQASQDHQTHDEIDKEEKTHPGFSSGHGGEIGNPPQIHRQADGNLQTNIKEWEAKALDLSQRLAQFNRVKGKVDRLKTLYDRLTNNLKDVDVSQASISATRFP